MFESIIDLLFEPVTTLRLIRFQVQVVNEATHVFEGIDVLEKFGGIVGHVFLLGGVFDL